VAQRICRAGIAAAQGLEIATVASGVDDILTRDALLGFGCRYGSGDLFPSPELAAPAERPMVKRVAR
jgi:EAL domain-containing protein (putative c-di-GMP-specific phosphodiesterase class I)